MAHRAMASHRERRTSTGRPRYKSASLDADAGGLSRSTLTTQLKETLRADIVSGKFAPGQHITVTEVSQRYRVSATPAREALARLAGEGFIQLRAQHSAQVAPLSLAEVRDLYEVRLLLEPEALARSIRRLDGDRGANLSEALERLRDAADVLAGAPADAGRAMTRWSDAHRDFHTALFESSGSPVLIRLISILNDQSERYRLISMRNPSIGRSFDEHESIYAAVMERDEAQAKLVLRRHLEGTVRVLASAVSEPTPSPVERTT